jgi:thymidine kinase
MIVPEKNCPRHDKKGSEPTSPKPPARRQKASANATKTKAVVVSCEAQKVVEGSTEAYKAQTDTNRLRGDFPRIASRSGGESHTQNFQRRQTILMIIQRVLHS